MPVNEKDWRVAGGTKIQNCAGNEGNVPDCLKAQAKIKQIQNFVCRKVDHISANGNAHNYVEGTKQSRVCFAGY